MDKEELLEYCFDLAEEIWTNRALGLKDKRDCPFCAYSSLVMTQCEGDERCYHCPIYHCFNSPYGGWNEDNDFWDDEELWEKYRPAREKYEYRDNDGYHSNYPAEIQYEMDNDARFLAREMLNYIRAVRHGYDWSYYKFYGFESCLL